jgi:hypothetical protein
LARCRPHGRCIGQMPNHNVDLLLKSGSTHHNHLVSGNHHILGCLSLKSSDIYWNSWMKF